MTRASVKAVLTDRKGREFTHVYSRMAWNMTADQGGITDTRIGRILGLTGDETVDILVRPRADAGLID